MKKKIEITEWIWTNRSKLEFECMLDDRLTIGSLGAHYIGRDELPEVYINELDTTAYGNEKLICEYAAELIGQDPLLFQQIYEDSAYSDGDRAYDAWRDDQ